MISRDSSTSGCLIYRLTRPGADLLPTMQALAIWGHANIRDRWAPPDWFLSAKAMDFYPPETA